MPTKAERLTCRTIADLDNGLFAECVDSEIRKIVSDLEDRGHDGQDRTLTLTIAFSRDTKRNPGECVIAIDPQVQAKLPKYRSNVTTSRIAPSMEDGELGLLFQAMNAENPDQPSLLDDKDNANRS